MEEGYLQVAQIRLLVLEQIKVDRTANELIWDTKRDSPKYLSKWNLLGTWSHVLIERSKILI